MTTPLTHLPETRMSASPLLVNLRALIPRHWFIYLICLLFPMFIYINLDHGPQADDSGHYFNFWFFGVIYTAYGIGFVVADLMNKPIFYCMPQQQFTLRRLIVGAGCLASVLFYILAVLPKHSYWAPPSILGELSPLPIGLMIFLLIVTLTIKSNSIASIVLIGLILGSVGIISIYFGGTGADIVRPPAIIFSIMAMASLLVVPWFWFRLGRSGFRRELIGSETLSSHLAGGITAQLENASMFQRLPQEKGGDFGQTRVGQWLLSKLRSPANGKRRSIVHLAYVVASAKDFRQVILAWMVAVTVGLMFAANLTDEFEVSILFHVLTALSMGQGALIFKKQLSPFLPVARRASFFESLHNGLLRHLWLLAVFGAVFALASLAYSLWPNHALSKYFLALTQFPFKGYLYCFLVAPILLYLFHRARSPAWLVFSLVICWLLGVPPLSQAFSNLTLPWILLLFAAAWLPFLTLNYLRSFKHDLK